METALCSVIYVYVNIGFSNLDTSFMLFDERDSFLKTESFSFPFNPNLITNDLLSVILADAITLLKERVIDVSISEEVQIVKYVNKGKYIVDLNELRKNNWNIIDFGRGKKTQTFGDNLSKNVCNITMDYEYWNLVCTSGGKKKLEVSLNFDTVEKFVKNIDLQKLLAFLTIPITAIELEELLAVFYTERAFNMSSLKVQDVLRGLIMQFIRQNNAVEDFFMSNKQCDVWVSGEMIEFLTFEELLLAIVDGIGCGVPIDIYFQNGKFPLDFLKRVFAKLEMSELSKMGLNFHPIKYIPLRYDRLKKSGTALVGTIKSEKTKEQFFIVTDEMRMINVSEKSEVSIALEEGVSIQTMRSNKNNFVLEVGEQILFDGRFSPIVYGDSYQNNRIQIINWLEQLR